MSEPTSAEYPEEGQPVTTPESAAEAMEAVEEAAVEAEATAVADVADDYEAEVGAPLRSRRSSPTAPCRPSAAARRPWSASGWSPAPESSR